MGKPGFQNGMDRHEQKRKAETDGLMDILDPLGLPDEILLSVFRHLPIHIVYGSGEQEQPTGMIAVCKRWFTVIKKAEPGFFRKQKEHFWKSQTFARERSTTLWRFMGSTLGVELPQEDEEAIRLQVTRCVWRSGDYQAFGDDPDRVEEEEPEGVARSLRIGHYSMDLTDGFYHLSRVAVSNDVIVEAGLRPYDVVSLDRCILRHGSRDSDAFTLEIKAMSVHQYYGFDRPIYGTTQIRFQYPQYDEKAAAMAYDWVSWLNYDIDPGVYVRHPLHRDFTATSWGIRVQISFDPRGGPQITWSRRPFEGE